MNTAFAFCLAFLSSGSLAAAQGNLIGLEATGTRLVAFDAGAPGTLLAITPVSGLAAGEALLGIDVRPATGELYGIGTFDRVYAIDPATGIATPKGASAFTPPVAGRGVGLDFNPVPDRLRVVTTLDQSLRLNSDTGAIAGVDAGLAYGAGDANAGANPFVAACAYTNAYAGATSTTLYAIDAALDVLVGIGGPGGVPSPNGGVLTTVGALGVDTTGLVGMDVSPFGGAFAVMNLAGESASRLYTLNLGTGAATLVGTIGGGMRLRDVAVRAPLEPRVYGATGANRLVAFLPGRPGTLVADVAITGLSAGETVEGLDVRPATGELVALGSTSRIYALDRASGAATPIGAGAFTPALAGAAFGFDFNPVPDRIRVVADAGQNLRLNPNNGVVAGVDTPLAYAPGDAGAGTAPSVVGSAYTNDFAGATTTTLYGIDAARDVLVTQGNVNGTPNGPNGGLLFTVGALGVDAGAATGFDVSPFGGVLASLTAPGASSSSLYSVHLATGAATLLGAIAGAPLRALAIEHPPVTRAVALTATNQLVTFALGTPAATSAPLAITGLQAGETLLGVDYRPATGGLVGVGSTSRLYAIDRVTGSATAIGATPFTPAILGVEAGVDFNPTVDRFRLVTDAGQNLRLHPGTGAVAGVDTNLAFAPGDANTGAIPREVAVAYDRNFAGATQTTMFGIDSALDVLVTQGSVNASPSSPNSGLLFTVGALGVDVGDLAGFDVSAFGGAFAALTPAAGPATLYHLNLTTGAATSIGAIGAGLVVRDVAIVPAGL